jgi:hypothetical protein
VLAAVQQRRQHNQVGSHQVEPDPAFPAGTPGIKANDCRAERDSTLEQDVREPAGLSATPSHVAARILGVSLCGLKHALHGAATLRILGRRVSPQIRSTFQQFLPIKFSRNSHNLRLVD